MKPYNSFAALLLVAGCGLPSTENTDRGTAPATTTCGDYLPSLDIREEMERRFGVTFDRPLPGTVMNDFAAPSFCWGAARAFGDGNVFTSYSNEVTATTKPGQFNFTMDTAEVARTELNGYLSSWRDINVSAMMEQGWVQELPSHQATEFSIALTNGIEVRVAVHWYNVAGNFTAKAPRRAYPEDTGLLAIAAFGTNRLPNLKYLEGFTGIQPFPPGTNLEQHFGRLLTALLGDSLRFAP